MILAYAWINVLSLNAIKSETRRLEAVDPATRADVQDGFTGAHRLQPGRRTTAIGNLEHLLRDEGLEMAHVIAGRATHLLARAGCPGVSIADGLGNILSWHGSPANIFRYVYG